MRGGPAFAVSLVLSSLEPALRAAAELGAWQIISPVNALGRVEIVGGLHEVQDKVRQSPNMPAQHLHIRNCAVAEMSIAKQCALALHGSHGVKRNLVQERESLAGFDC